MVVTLQRFFGAPVAGPVRPPPESPKQRRSAKKTASAKAKAKASTAFTTPRKRTRKDAGAGSPVSATKRPQSGKKRLRSPSKKLSSPAKVKKSQPKRPPRATTARWVALRGAGLKAPRNAFALWSNDNWARVQKELGDAADFASVSRALGEAWGKLSDKAKAPYLARKEELRRVFVEAKQAYLQYAKQHAKLGAKAKARGAKAGRASTA